jgi:hypothetical protein
MVAKNIRNIKTNISGNLMHIQRRKGTQNPSLMPPDPKEKREEKERNAHTVTKDSIQNPHACKKNRSDVLDTSAKQPWRSHPRECKEEEFRRSEFQERQF